MKCQECGTEFQGNFCPSCGKKVAEEAEASVSNKENEEHIELLQENENNSLSVITEMILLVVITVLLLRFGGSGILVVGLWLAVIVNFVIAKKQNNTMQRAIEIIGIILVFVAAFQIYNGWQDNKYIKIVQNQYYVNYIDANYKELFDKYSQNVSWECIERGRFTTVDTNEPMRSGSYDAIVTVSGDCTVWGEETIYTLRFNVSKEDNRAVPVELSYGNNSETSTYEINIFLDAVFENYIE